MMSPVMTHPVVPTCGAAEGEVDVEAEEEQERRERDQGQALSERQSFWQTREGMNTLQQQ